jgi:hypothetical protein
MQEQASTWKVLVSWVRSARVPDTVTVRCRTPIPNRASTVVLPLLSGATVRTSAEACAGSSSGTAPNKVAEVMA